MSPTPAERVERAAAEVFDLTTVLFLSTTTRDTIRDALDKLRTDLTDIAADIRHRSFDPGALGSHARKVHDSQQAAARRPENIPLEDPDVIAARWGVVDRGEPGEVPEWFRERFDRILTKADHEEAQPSTGPESQ